MFSTQIILFIVPLFQWKIPVSATLFLSTKTFCLRWETCSLLGSHVYCPWHLQSCLSRPLSLSVLLPRVGLIHPPYSCVPDETSLFRVRARLTTAFHRPPTWESVSRSTPVFIHTSRQVLPEMERSSHLCFGKRTRELPWLPLTTSCPWNLSQIPLDSVLSFVLLSRLRSVSLRPSPVYLQRIKLRRLQSLNSPKTFRPTRYNKVETWEPLLLISYCYSKERSGTRESVKGPGEKSLTPVEYQVWTGM